MIYLDNAATSYPKPEAVTVAIKDCLENKGANPGRGSHRMAMEAAKLIFHTRRELAGLIGAGDAADVLFTLNCTDAINIALKGFLRAGDHVVTTSVEHNAVSRPLDYLVRERGIVVTKVPAGEAGSVSSVDIARAIRPETKLVVCTHASNVAGEILPIEEIAHVTHAAGALMLVDGAQTVGSVPIDVGRQGIDMLAMAGHKSLLGPQGVGALCVSGKVDLVELRQGGTGGDSAISQPTTRPDRYEAGTPNTPGIAGLGAAIGYIRGMGTEQIRRHEVELTSYLLEELQSTKGVKVYGPLDAEKRVPLVTFNIDGVSPQEVATELDRHHDIAVRSGLHCAPDAHESLGTGGRGAVRVSLSVLNSMSDLQVLCSALRGIAAGRSSG